jgi:hypothetical protein
MNPATTPGFESLQRLWQQDLAAAQAHSSTQFRQAVLPVLIERRLEPGPWSVGFSVLTIILLGAYCAQQWGAWRYVLPGAVLLLWCVAMLVASLRTKAALATLDYGRPVLELQRELAEIRTQRLWLLHWGFLTGWVLWLAPFCVVLLRALTGAPVLEGAALVFVFQAMAWTAAAIPLQWLLWKGLRRFWHGHNAMTQLGDAVTGRDLAEIKRLLSRLQ